MLIQDIIPVKRETKQNPPMQKLRKMNKKARNKALPVLLVVFLIVQIIAGPLVPFNFSLNPSSISLQEAQAAGESWYNANWTRRKAITVTENSGSTLTDYQVKITISYDTDMQADFNDIRFTDSDGSTLIDHWLQSKTDSTTADFWVEIPTLTASSTKTIYIYYGNPSASSASNETNTFDFFDDFSSGVLDDSWSQTDWLERPAVISTEWSSGPDDYSVKIFCPSSDCDIGIKRSMSVTNVKAMIDYNITDTGTYYEGSLYTGTTIQEISTTVETVYNWESNAITALTPYDLSFRHRPRGPNAQITAYIDRIRVRKYVSPEPTASVGIEEERSVPYAPLAPQCEGASNPIDVLDVTPEFDAEYDDPNTGDIANHYEIEVNTESDFTGTVMWDTGKISMSNVLEGSRGPSSPVSYAGAALSLDGSGYFWRIKFWDDEGYEGDWSATQSFTMRFSIPIAPTSPYCEGTTNPTNVSEVTPEFSAVYNDHTGDTANKYRIQVNTKSDLTGTVMWDSGAAGTSMTNCAEGTRCQDISYAGTALSLDGSGYFWRIKFWDDEGYEGAWSVTQSFTFTSESWLSGWVYRKSIRIEEKSGSNLTDYSVLVTIDTQSLISAGKLQSGCQDIRFTDKDGSTTIDYWIESGCNTASTEIWVKIPSLSALTAKNIYFYYGNTSASSVSNKTNTFEFFDDFNDGDISNVDDGSALGWGGIFQNISEENGILTFFNATTNDVCLQIDTGYPADYFPAGSVIRARVKMVTSSTNFWLGMFADEWDNGWGETEVINEWVEISYTETTAFNKIGFDPYYFTDLTNDQFQIDWVYVHKYVSPEPSIGALATEEADTTPPTAFDISSPINNSLALSDKPTLSWSASSDSRSGLAKYQLYIDNSLDTDNISSSTTSVTPTNSLSCGNRTWYIRTYDNADNYTDSSVFNLTMVCGSGLPPSASNQPITPEPTPENPEGRFSVLINNDDEYTNDQTVTLKLSAGKDTKRMAISNTEDFKYASQIPYQEEYRWELSSCHSEKATADEESRDHANETVIQNNTKLNSGSFTTVQDDGIRQGDSVCVVYAKFYTQYGVSSEVVSDSIILKTIITETGTEETTNIEIEEQTENPNKEEPISETKDNKGSESPKDTEPDKTNPSKPSSFIFTKPLKLGSFGTEVTNLQNKLKELNFFPKETKSNSNFGLATENAVKKYQTSKEIYPCGIVGPRTRKALNNEEFITNKDHKFTKDLKYNDKSEEVKQLQTRLRDQNFFPYNIQSTGWFGSVTQGAVNIFQKFYGLIQSGIVDEGMRGVLNG